MLLQLPQAVIGELSSEQLTVMLLFLGSPPLLPFGESLKSSGLRLEYSGGTGIFQFTSLLLILVPPRPWRYLPFMR